ncbi:MULTISPECIES: hypothetical protein [unclassified Crossiella]|uniref:hypothetical protein n=1 Tax=unclassified Crossiella TaxID=2620835 RepID=UPI001FFE5D15|nr:MULTISPECIES: hypothetical protein [unclassified Crossiella]MCK2243621.1 hypothetical protein [Crossiella sp. S99.2]MCK2257479.1 hypothetical protein [Crossiella sp. S99.1]
MSAAGDPTPGQQRLADCAEGVFDALYRADLDTLLARCGPRAKLRDKVVRRADKLLAKLAGSAEAVQPGEGPLLIAACLTWGRNQAGIATNTTNAVRKFRRYRRFAQLPLEILVRTDRTVPDDDRVISVLARTLCLRTRVSEAVAGQEPELILNMVLPAIVAALGPAHPAEDRLTEVALDVLDRGAELAAAHLLTRRRAGVGDPGLPVLGNADFLIRIAAYRVAIQEQHGQEPAPLAQSVTELSTVLRKAMTTVEDRPNRRSAGEPDVAIALNRYAEHLGAVAGNPAREAVRAVHAVLNHRLGLTEPPHQALADLSDLPAPAAEHPTRRLEAEHLVGWLIAGLFRGAGPEARGPLLNWLDGKHTPDEPRHLPLLVRRLRIAIKILEQVPEAAAPRPAGLSPSRFQALLAQLTARIDPGQLTGRSTVDAHYVPLATLPPLWTDRHPARELVGSHLRIQLGTRPGSEHQAALVAGHGVRAPQQFVHKALVFQEEPCCPEPRPERGDRPREPVPDTEVCPHRPWGEVGRVENYHTLGRSIGCSADAARQQLRRYQGPWPELLWP